MTSRLKRMAVVANTDWFLANFLSGFLALHVERGVEVTALSPAGRYVDALRGMGAAWSELPLARGRVSPANALIAARALAKALRETRPDVVHLITAMPVLLGRWATHPEQKVVSVLPGLGRAFASSDLTSVFDRSIIRWGVGWAAGRPNSRVVFHQSSDRVRLLGLSGASLSNTALIPGWGVDLHRFSVSRVLQTPPLVVMISRMLWTKGVLEFVEAAASCQRVLKARFVLVGGTDEGNPDAIAASKLEAWSSLGSVEWWGHRQDIPEILSKASVCVLPTKYGEGVPQSLIEAAAAGVPTVASDIPGCREVITQGRNGLLVPPGDSERVAEAVLSLLQAPGLSAKMGRAGREIARERFSPTVILDAYRRLYEDLGLDLPET